MKENERSPITDAEKETPTTMSASEGGLKLARDIFTAARIRATKQNPGDCLDIPSAARRIDAYTNGLVAAAVSECAKHIPHIYYDEQGGYLGCECGWKTYSRITWAEHLSTVTLESAAKELERIKMDARQEGMKREIAAQMAHVKDYPNLGDCEWNCTTAEPLQALLEKIGIGRIKAEARLEGRLEEHVDLHAHGSCGMGECLRVKNLRAELEAAKEK